MAGSVANSVKVVGLAVTSLTTSAITTTTGNTIVIGHSAEQGRSPGTPTDSKSNSYTQMGTVVQPSGGGDLNWWVKENAAGGSSHTFTCTWGIAANPVVLVAELAGVLAASYDSGSRAQGSDTSSPFTVTSGTLAQADSIVLCLVGASDGVSNPATKAESTGFTIFISENDESQYWAAAMAYKVVSATTALTPSWTSSGDSVMGLHIAAFKASASATLDQEGARFGADDGSESAHGWAAAQDAGVTAPLGANILLRALVDAVSGDPSNNPYKLKSQKNGSGGYVDVPTVANVSESYGTVTFGAIGTGANGSTSVAPSYPSGITVGQYLTCHVSSGATNSETPSTPSGWTLLATDASTNGTYGIDTGPRRMTVFGKIADGTESGTLTVSITNGGTCRGTIARWTKSGSGEWQVTGQGANDSTSGTGVSMTFGSMNWNTGDAVLVAVGQRVDSATQSSQSLTASGVTFGTRTNRATTAVTTGNDHRHVVDTFAAVSGTSNVNAAPTWAYTASASVSAGGVIVRLREYTAAVTNQVYVSASSNIAAGGEDTTARLTAPSGKTTSNFTTGRRWDDENGSDSIDIASGNYTELEWSLQAQSPAADTDYFDFRVYNGNTALDTYTVTPRWTIGSGSSPGAVAESTAASDAQTSSFIATGNRAETAAASDAQSAVAAFPASRAETAAASDAQSTTLGVAGTAVETSAAIDAQSATVIFGGSAAETSAAIDAQSASFIATGTRAETSAATDASTATAAAFAAQAEAAAASDAQSAVTTLPVSSTEAAAASDAQTSSFIATGTRTETAAASDAQSASAAVIGAAAETVAAIDATSSSSALLAAQGESAATTDTESAAVAALRAIAETASPAEAQDATVVAGLVALTEASAIADTQSASFAAVGAMAETAAASDAQASAAAFHVARAETSAATDAQSASTSGTLSGSLAETSAAADSAAAALAAVAAVAETSAATDSIASALATLAAVAETSAATDSIAATRVAPGAIAETLSALEILGVSAVFGGSVGESVAAVDASALTAILVGALAESVALADLCNAFSGSASVSESAAIADASNWIAEEVLTRVLRILAEDRSIQITSELREAIIAAESRVRVVDSQTREVDL